MTITQMHTLIDQLCDKAGAPWFNATEKDRFINMAQIEFVQTRGDQLEFNERRREDLIKLIRTSTTAASATIDLSAITSFMRVAQVLGTFTDMDCTDGTITVPVRPVQLDDLGNTMRNPFTSGVNSDPFYIQYNNGTSNIIEVKSETTPISLLMYYLKMPVDVNSQSVPAVDSELPSYTHDELVKIAVRIALGTLRDMEGYQIEQNEITKQQ
jgi:hypothetical protein